MTDENRIIRLSAGTTEIEVWSIGARLNGVIWNGSDNFVDGASSVAEALGAKLNHGAVVGPVANRIAGAAFELDGRTYRFEPNEGEDTLLHSGHRSLRDRVWEVATADDLAATLVSEVADMTDGFPGNRRFEARYAVADDGFELVFTAVSDAATLVNMALHPYWRLDAGGREGLRLHVNADAYLPTDDRKIPTGDVAEVDGTRFDFRKMALPGTDVDHNFCLASGGTSASLASANIRLDISTDAPGLQVFTGKTVGIALEPQHWPDAPGHPEFPSIRLGPGETYRQRTRYRFSAA